MTIRCPGCGGDIEVEVSSDYQGEGAWGMQVSYGEIVEKPCYCMLSQSQEDEIFKDVEESESESSFDPWI